jgi:hypothetical protein
VNVSAWAVPGNDTWMWHDREYPGQEVPVSLLTLARDYSAAALHFYTDYFDYQLPFNEVKLVSVPGKVRCLVLLA